MAPPPSEVRMGHYKELMCDYSFSLRCSNVYSLHVSYPHRNLYGEQALTKYFERVSPWSWETYN